MLSSSVSERSKPNQRSNFNPFCPGLLEPIQYQGVVSFSRGDDRNLGLNGLLHDVVELDLIGSDDVDGHIHLVILD